MTQPEISCSTTLAVRNSRKWANWLAWHTEITDQLSRAWELIFATWTMTGVRISGIRRWNSRPSRCTEIWGTTNSETSRWAADWRERHHRCPDGATESWISTMTGGKTCSWHGPTSWTISARWFRNANTRNRIQCSEISEMGNLRTSVAPQGRISRSKLPIAGLRSGISTMMGAWTWSFPCWVDR